MKINNLELYFTTDTHFLKRDFSHICVTTYHERKGGWCELDHSFLTNIKKARVNQNHKYYLNVASNERPNLIMSNLSSFKIFHRPAVKK